MIEVRMVGAFVEADDGQPVVLVRRGQGGFVTSSDGIEGYPQSTAFTRIEPKDSPVNGTSAPDFGLMSDS